MEKDIPDWRAALQEAEQRYRHIQRGDLQLTLERIVREPVPRIVGHLPHRRGTIGSLYCPDCHKMHAAPMAIDRELYVQLPCGRFAIVRAWSPRLDVEDQRKQRELDDARWGA